MMKIRKAILEDIKKIAEIASVLYLDIKDFVWTMEDFIRKQVEKGEYYVAASSVASAAYFAEASSVVKAGKEEEAVGVISLRERNGMLYIETLAVAKNVQSSGVGKKLVEFAKQFARENNFKILRTTSFYEYGVKDFYIKNGFYLLDEPGEYGGHKFYRLEFKLNE